VGSILQTDKEWQRRAGQRRSRRSRKGLRKPESASVESKHAAVGRVVRERERERERARYSRDDRDR
jgi:hypothetical protein